MYLTQKPARVVINATCAKHRERKNGRGDAHAQQQRSRGDTQQLESNDDRHSSTPDRGLLLVRVG